MTFNLIISFLQSCWGPNAHGMKSASGKMAKQAALAFVKRTLERYREFEDTGKSCFDDPLYKDIFHSGISRLIDGQPNFSTDTESGKHHLGASGCSVEVRNSGKCQINLQDPYRHSSVSYLVNSPSPYTRNFSYYVYFCSLVYQLLWAHNRALVRTIRIYILLKYFHQIIKVLNKLLVKKKVGQLE